MKDIANIFRAKKTYILLGAAILFVGLFLALKNSSTTRAESAAVEDFASRVSNYFEYIDYQNPDYQAPENPDSLKTDNAAKYVSFAVNYLRSEEGRNEVSTTDIRILLDDTFADFSLTDEEIESAAPSIILAQNRIKYNVDTHSFSPYNNRANQSSSIAPVTKYLKTSIKHKDKSYIATYTRYTFTEPYDILNRATEAQSENASAIKNYLEGNGPIKDIKNAITPEIANACGTKENEIRITITTNDGKIRVLKYE